MFLFLDFILDNVSEYTNIINLLITSSTSSKQVKRYYICHIPRVLPFPLSKLSSNSTNSWDIFTDYLLSRPLFQSSSNFRIRLCVLLDFLKAEASFHTRVPNPRYNIAIYSDMVEFRNGEGCDDILWEYWDSYRGIDPAACTFCISSSTFEETTMGIVYNEQEYLRQKRNYDLRPNLNQETLDRESIHVLKMLGSVWIIIFVSDFTKNAKKLFSLQNYDTRIYNSTYLRHDTEFESRFI